MFLGCGNNVYEDCTEVTNESATKKGTEINCKQLTSSGMLYLKGIVLELKV